MIVAFSDAVTNDPYLYKQWYIHNTGQSPTNGTPGASSNFLYAWSITTGSSDVAIGIIDTGIAMENGQLSHPDLQNTNRIIPRINLIDSNDPDGVKDFIGHGTSVAGIIGAESNNQEGIAGVVNNTKLLIYKRDNTVHAGQLQEALFDMNDWALTTGDRIIVNFSASTINHSQALEDAIAYAYQNNFIFITTTGNEDLESVNYPAKFSNQYSNVIAVGGTDALDNRSNFSNYGTEVTLAAPAGSSNINFWCEKHEGIITTLPNYSYSMKTNRPSSFCALDYSYDYLRGTSYAAPQIAGAAALILSIDNTLTATQVRDRLTATADKVGGYNYDWNSAKPGHSKELGYGRLNAFAAVVGDPHHDFIFASSTTIGSGIYTGKTTIYTNRTVTIESGATVVMSEEIEMLEGTMSNTPVYGEILVKGTLHIANGTDIKGGRIWVEDGGEVIIGNGVTTKATRFLVEDGGSISVAPGADFRFDPGQRFEVSGHANIQGSSANNIQFKRSGSTGSWSGIRFNEGASGTIRYCNIRDASIGIRAIQTAPMIRDSKIQFNSTGI